MDKKIFIDFNTKKNKLDVTHTEYTEFTATDKKLNVNQATYIGMHDVLELLQKSQNLTKFQELLETL